MSYNKRPSNPTECKKLNELKFHMSVANMVTVANHFECGCEAYISVHTYAGWTDLGYQVQKGQKSCVVTTVKTGTNLDKDTGEEKTYSFRKKAYVFCRHQVSPLFSDYDPIPE